MKALPSPQVFASPFNARYRSAFSQRYWICRKAHPKKQDREEGQHLLSLFFCRHSQKGDRDAFLAWQKSVALDRNLVHDHNTITLLADDLPVY